MSDTTDTETTVEVETIHAVAVCSACWCLVAPEYEAAHDHWHALDMSVDVMAGAHIENLIERVLTLEGGDPREKPTGPSAADVFITLLEVYDPEGVARWMMSPNTSFEGRSPAQALVDGDTARVYDVVAGLVAGVMG